MEGDSKHGNFPAGASEGPGQFGSPCSPICPVTTTTIVVVGGRCPVMLLPPPSVHVLSPPAQDISLASCKHLLPSPLSHHCLLRLSPPPPPPPNATRALSIFVSLCFYEMIMKCSLNQNPPEKNISSTKLMEMRTGAAERVV